MTTSFARVTFDVSAGVAVWAVHFLAIYGFTALACAGRFHVGAIPWVVAAATLFALAAAGALVVRAATRCARRFIDWLSAAIAGLALLAIAWEALAAWIVPPCAT